MIDASDALIQYYNSTVRATGQFIKIVITTLSNTVYTLTDEAFVSGSVKINKKSISSSNFDIGEVYINDASFTVLNNIVDLTEELTGSTVQIYTGVVNSDLGLDESFIIFTGYIPANSVTRKIAITQVECDSILSLFDNSIGNTVTSGTLYSLVTFCCDNSGVEFSNTESDFNSLSDNSSYTYFITENTSISSYRDILMYIAQIMGGFFTDTPDGKLIFKTYSENASYLELNIDTIKSSTYGDSNYNINGMTWVFDGETVYISGDYSSTYVLELEENPLMSELTNDLFSTIGSNLYTQLAALNLRSFTLTYNGNPLLECGDIIKVSSKGVASFLMNTSWVYHGVSTINSYSVDKRTNTESQSVKSASKSGSGSSSSSNDLSVIRYINSKAISTGELWTLIVNTYYTTPAQVTPYIDFCGVVTVPADGLVQIKIIYDNVETILVYKWTLLAGVFTLAFSKSFSGVDTEMTHSLKIYINYTITDETYEGTDKEAAIDIYGLELNIIAYKAVSSAPSWSGRYELTDELTLPTLNNIIVPSISSDVASVAFDVE